MRKKEHEADLAKVFKKMPKPPTKEEGAVFRNIISQSWDISESKWNSPGTKYWLNVMDNQEISSNLPAKYNEHREPSLNIKPLLVGGGHGIGPAAFRLQAHSVNKAIPWFALEEYVDFHTRMKLLYDLIKDRDGIHFVADHWDIYTPSPWELYPLIWGMAELQMQGITHYGMPGVGTVHFRILMPLVHNKGHGRHCTTLAAVSTTKITPDEKA
jgi:hypothetical protein